jgi:hypothetical protein
LIEFAVGNEKFNYLWSGDGRSSNLQVVRVDWEKSRIKMMVNLV